MTLGEYAYGFVGLIVWSLIVSTPVCMIMFGLGVTVQTLFVIAGTASILFPLLAVVIVLISHGVTDQ